MRIQAGTCFICEQEIHVDATLFSPPDTLERRMAQHVMEEHTELERARFKLRENLETLNPALRVQVARDVYTSLSRPDDSVGCYTIDEALGSVTIHYFFQKAVRKYPFGAPGMEANKLGNTAAQQPLVS